MTIPEPDDHVGLPDGSAARPRGRFGRVLAVLTLVVVVLAVALFLTYDDDNGEATRASQPTTSSTESAPGGGTTSEVASFEGTGADTTKVFSVAANWELRWTVAAGKPFDATLLQEDGTSRGTVVTASDGKSDGTTFVSEEGKFKLEVKAGGPWTVRIVSQPTGG